MLLLLLTTNNYDDGDYDDQDDDDRPHRDRGSNFKVLLSKLIMQKSNSNISSYEIVRRWVP